MQIHEVTSSLVSGSMYDTDQWVAIDNQYDTNSASFKAELGEVKGYMLEGKVLPTGTIVGTTDTQTMTNKRLTTPKINDSVNCDITSEELNALHGATVSASTFQALGLAKIGGSGANDIPITGMYASSSHTHVEADITDLVPFTAEAFINELASGSAASVVVIKAMTGKLYDSTRFAALVAANWSGSAI